MTVTQHAVLYDAYGDASVLYLADAPMPSPGEERALVSMRAVGLNPYDAKARSGMFPRDAPFPRGIGGDIAGVVSAVGTGAQYSDGSAVQVGDAVFGWGVNTLRENVVVRSANIARVPRGLSLSQAGSLATPAFAAHALATALAFPERGTILVSAASGAVGFLLAQWGVRRGLRVLGTASESHFPRLRSVGIEPVSYGDALTEHLRQTLGSDELSAVYDSTGASTLAAATAAGAKSLVTIAGSEVAEQFGAISTTTTQRSATVLLTIAEEIAAGDVIYPVDSEFPLDQVVPAFLLLETGHPHGKVVVTSGA